ncbi:MAG: flagellar hook-length control protein FliK [Desulfomonilia bacterium]
MRKIFSHQGKAAGFDAELASAMSGLAGGGPDPLAGAGPQEDLPEEELLEALAAHPDGMLALGLAAALKEMGLQIADIQLLLSGRNGVISDSALESLLAFQGLGQADIDALMADTALKDSVKAWLSAKLSTTLSTRAAGGDASMEAIRSLAVSDAQALEALVASLTAGMPDAGGTMSDQAFPGVNEPAPGGGLPAADVIRQNISSLTAEISVLVADALRQGRAIRNAAPSRGAAPEAVNQAGLARSAEEIFGVKSEVLSDLFFSSDEMVRRQAVEEVTSRINAFLKAREGQGLTPREAEVLAFLKSAMSEQEFVGIETSLKLWQPGAVLPEIRAALGREGFEALARSLGGQRPETLLEQHMKGVMDQLRQTLPAHVKDGGGSVTLRLNPPLLGRVEVSMTMHDGRLEAVFKTDQSVTRDILVQNMHTLREALAEQGIRPVQLTVSTGIDQRPSGEGFAFARQDGHGRGASSGEGRSGFHGQGPDEPRQYVHTQASMTGSAQGGLDLFA